MLEVRELRTVFPLKRGTVKAADGISFSLKRGEKLGIVGESGSGKSVTLLSIMRLVPYPGIISGSIVFNGIEILKLDEREMRKIRGREISMVFQDPMTTLNPVFKVGDQITESLRVHGIGRKFGKGSKSEYYEKAVELMREVGIPSPEERFFQYPHEFSGGMQQRVLIAIALACSPKLLLADEPTTALDVTVQAQILHLLDSINKKHGTSIILVTHDLAVAAEFCDKIMVMYAGKMVEYGKAEEIIYNPKHPYTVGLLNSIPVLGDKSKKIRPIPGNVPDLANTDDFCSFRPRCDRAMGICAKEPVGVFELEGGRRVRCHLYKDKGAKIDE